MINSLLQVEKQVKGEGVYIFPFHFIRDLTPLDRDCFDMYLTVMCERHNLVWEATDDYINREVILRIRKMGEIDKWR